MQARGQSRRNERRIAECRHQGLGIGQVESRERHAARAGLAAQALDEAREPLVAVELIVAIRVDHERRSFGDVSREVVEHLGARLVGPLNIVHHQNERPTLSRRLEDLAHRARQASLACLGKIARQLRQIRKSLGHRGNQCSELGERYGRDIAQRGRGRAVERPRDEVDHGLIGDRPLDLVAVGRERGQALGFRIACDLAHQPALADTRLAFEQDGVPGAGGEARDEPDEQAVLVASADKGCGIARGAHRRIGRGVDRRAAALASVPTGRASRCRRFAARTARAASRKSRRSSAGMASAAASRSASGREGLRSSASIFRIAKPEQLTRWASASWVRSSALRRRRSQ